jgi:hypothetical protein
MRAQLQYADRPAAASEGHALHEAPLAPVQPLKPHSARADEPPQPEGSSTAPTEPDSPLTLLYVFLGAMVIIVGDVVLAGAVEHFWILVPTMGIHLLLTFIVFAAIMRLLDDDGEGDVPDEP